MYFVIVVDNNFKGCVMIFDDVAFVSDSCTKREVELTKACIFSDACSVSPRVVHVFIITKYSDVIILLSIVSIRYFAGGSSRE